MPRSQSPVLLPGDPTAALHATTKQYVDAGLALKLNASLRGAVNGVGSLGADGKQPSSELAGHSHSGVEYTANKGATNGYAPLDGSALLSNAYMPLVLSPVRSATVSSSYTPDVTSLGNFFDLTATANIIIGSPNGSANHQVVKLAIQASGGTYTITFTGSIVLSTGLVSAYSVASGKVLIAALQYTSFLGAWVLTAATVSS